MKNEINKNKALDKTLAVSGRFLFLDDIRHPYDAFEHTQQTNYVFAEKMGSSKKL